uniref:(northern house mosquito) hypothetical protein n=1 Tax=Culex pipiens TaxID=7175 RepID=A0A8D8KP47_CULPI
MLHLPEKRECRRSGDLEVTVRQIKSGATEGVETGGGGRRAAGGSNDPEAGTVCCVPAGRTSGSSARSLKTRHQACHFEVRFENSALLAQEAEARCASVCEKPCCSDPEADS